VNNTFGKPVQGAIAVVDATDLTKEVKIVVPKAIAAGDKTAGIYIYEDWIYYATPNSDKDKKGEVQSSYLDFCRTKLDGTKTETILYTSVNNTAYRYAMGSNGEVVLAYHDSTANKIVSYNFTTKAKTVLAEDIAACVFSKDVDSGVVYYTKAVVLDEENDVVASYNKVYKVNFLTGATTEVLSGEPQALVNGVSNGAVSSQGFTLGIVDHKDGVLSFTCTYVDGTAFRGGYVLKDADVTENAIKNLEEKAIKLSVKETNFTAGKIVTVGDQMGYIYSDETYGLMRQMEGEQPARVCTATTTTILSVQGDYIYFTADSKMVRVPVTAEDAQVSDLRVFTEKLYSTSWYQPEIFGTKMFYGDATDSRNYVRYVDLVDEEMEPTFLGKYNAADQAAVDAEEEKE
ncbi:MAG: DUF5050 domain-containing protein, partial [Clostridia bacterium]|nr:DUF5050 domain-containing protein [Clostridia bacterium]